MFFFLEYETFFNVIMYFISLVFLTDEVIVNK